MNWLIVAYLLGLGPVTVLAEGAALEVQKRVHSDAATAIAVIATGIALIWPIALPVFMLQVFWEKRR